jgi:LPXTG-motif cell wall-anchored protein
MILYHIEFIRKKVEDDLGRKTNKRINTSIRKYSIRLASLFLSTLLLMNGAPVISVAAAEQMNEGDEVENVETDESEIEETEAESLENEEVVQPTSRIATFSATVSEDELNSDGTDESGESEENSEESGEENQDDPNNPTVEITTETEEAIIPFETEYVQDPTLLEGEERVEQEGQDGLLERTVEITTDANGVIVSEEIIGEEVIIEAIPEIILVGTMVEDEPEPPAPEPGEPDAPEEPTPQPEEPTDPEETQDPMLQVDPIYPEAETISGFANPNAQVVVFYPGTSRQRSANVNGNGDWMIRNLGGDASSLTEGATVPMQLIYENQVHEYEDQFYVQSESGPTDYYAAEVGVSEDSSTAENSSEENLSSSSISETPENSEKPELLPETGESVNGSMLGLTTLAAGLGLMVISKKKESKELN